jgi:hypothetical protein
MLRALLIVIFALAAASVATAQEPPTAPYQRMRTGAGDWSMRGGHNQNWRGGWGGYGGFYNPFFFQPIVTGSWYERPYPYHFDYYRYRWGGQGNASRGGPAPYGDPSVEMIPAADCPCLSAPAATGPAPAAAP